LRFPRSAKGLLRGRFLEIRFTGRQLGATLLGRIAGKSGLARRLTYAVMSRVGATYSRILLGLIINDFLLTFIIPSGLARIAILATDGFELSELEVPRDETPRTPPDFE
jgi:di/tricarboxylate transporter